MAWNDKSTPERFGRHNQRSVKHRLKKGKGSYTRKNKHPKKGEDQ